MRTIVRLAGMCMLAGGAACDSSTEPTEPEFEGMTGAWIGVAPVFADTDSLELFIADSAGSVQVSGRFHSGAYQQYTGGIVPSSPAGLKLTLYSISPPFFATLDVRLDGARLVGSYNDHPVTLTGMHPPPVPPGLWIRTGITSIPGPTFPTTDSIWIHADGRVQRKLEVRYDVDYDCSNVGKGVPLDRPSSVVLIYLFLTSGSACNLPGRDSLIIQGSTLRRRTSTIFGVIEEVYEHRTR